MNDHPESAEAALARISTEAQKLAAEHAAASTDLVAANVPAEAVKAQLADRRSALLHKQAELKEAAERMRAEMQSMMDAAMAAMAPLQKEAKQLAEGIWTANLYLGRDEEIVPLRGGEPAPADTPIHIRQLVLSMDEETAIGAERGGIDHAEIEKFDEWLLKDPAHLDQVLPENKGVVVLVPRRRGRDYGDPWTNTARNKENEQSYWLIRNGERLYRMRTDFTVGTTIMPKRTEFTDLFYRDDYEFGTHKRTRVLMEPGSSQWMKAEEKQGARQRHYMRSALILQGLLDRTSVFEPKPAYPVSFVNGASYDAGHVVLINDAEDDRQLTTSREPFYQWIGRLNKQLRPGMRIVGAFGVDAFRYDTVDGKSYGSAHNRLRPNNVHSPRSNVIHYLDGRRDGGLVFKYDREDTIWDDDDREFRTPKTRASCVIYPTDRFILPFDLVTVDEMRTYLNARLERHAYEDMFPVLKTAIRLKEKEAAAEAPMRDLIVAQLINAGADREEAEREVPALIEWWKLANKWHRPLVSDGGPDEAKAVKGIVAEYKQRMAAVADPDRDADMIARLKHCNPLLIAQQRDGRWVMLTEPEGIDAYGRAVAPKTWCTEFIYPRSGIGPTVREWILPGSRPNRWRIVWAREDWATWDRSASLAEHLSGPEIDALAAEVRETVMAKYGAENDYLGTTYRIADHQDIEYSQFRVWMMPNDPERDYPVRYAFATWTRTTGGKVAIEHGTYTHVQSYSGEQLFGVYTHDGRKRGPEVLDVGQNAVARLDARIAEQKAARDARHAEWLALVGLEDSVVAEWRRRKVAREFEKFMDDFRDETLWPAHEAKLDLRYPYATSHRHHDSNLLKMISTLKDADQQVVGRTVAELAEAYAVLGHEFKVPADIADITVQGPSNDSQED